MAKVFLITALVCCGVTARTARAAEELPGERALAKARVGGKYEMLLRQIKVPADAESYADFRDVGLKDRKEYAGFRDLPKGYWVYVYPYWYIWRDLSSAPKLKRPWGPEQATGEPDTPAAGDMQSAWASLTPDQNDEWLLLEYAQPVAPESVLIYETFNPGAVNRVTVFKLTGEEVEVWKGKDPTPRDSGMGVSEIPVRVSFKTNRVKVYLQSTAVPGWNEIDAVGLRDRGGKTQWARSAEASSTYAAQQGVGGMILIAPAPVAVRLMPARVAKAAPAKEAPPAKASAPAAPKAPAETPEKRVERLQKEVETLRAEVKKLTDKLQKYESK